MEAFWEAYEMRKEVEAWLEELENFYGVDCLSKVPLDELKHMRSIISKYEDEGEEER